MGGIWSTEKPKPVTLYVRVKEKSSDKEPDDPEDVEGDFVSAKHVRPGQRVIELTVHQRFTFGEVKQRLQEEFGVFSDKWIHQWKLAISGMDGNPRMFAFCNKTAEPDTNAYLYEAGIEELAELIAYLPIQD
mmetsp:Transcript_3763/g.8717  ORF Transcript_3763/g.8717 Transcript_3763/m.8717 type:complete len:132 (+) Transcript_3763:61-456(+)